jgi:hypothetical protein
VLHVPIGSRVTPRRGVTLVHRGRFGGNARKRKAKLTDATFHAMIGTGAIAETQVASLAQDTVVLEVLLAEEDVQAGLSACAAPLSPVRPRSTRQFRCQDFEFGYAVCRNCHNDQAYYIHQADLTDGYSFRCRVCRLEMTVWAKS